jgi:hypothetical protein
MEENMGRPVKVYRAGRTELAIFQGEYNGKTTYSFKFQKSYKGQDGEWKNTDFFNDTDMGDVSALADHIRAGRVREKNIQPKPETKPEPKPEPETENETFEDDIPF